MALRACKTFMSQPMPPACHARQTFLMHAWRGIVRPNPPMISPTATVLPSQQRQQVIALLRPLTQPRYGLPSTPFIQTSALVPSS